MSSVRPRPDAESCWLYLAARQQPHTSHAQALGRLAAHNTAARDIASQVGYARVLRAALRRRRSAAEEPPA